MKIIHFSDTHLGINIENTCRDEDFYRNFLKIIDDIIKIKPDFVIHTGDLFHYSKPNNKAISIALEGFLKLSKNGIKTILIAGNHSTPRLQTTTHPFEILKNIENIFTFYEQKLDNIEFEKINFVCLPHIYDENKFREELSKSNDLKKENKLNILMSHFGLQSKDYDEYTDEISGVNILVSDLEKIKSFDYVALGHYHKNFCLAKNICYSGSIEKTSFNQKDYKIGYNIVNFDQELKVDFIELESRKMLDLGNIDCINFTSTQELIEKMEETIDKKNLNDAIVKIFFKNIKTKLMIAFDDNKIVSFFKDSFYFEYKKDFYSEQRDNSSNQKINTNDENFMINVFSDFLGDYELNEINIDKTKLKDELLELMKKYKKEA